jgi:hypothetical protein
MKKNGKNIASFLTENNVLTSIVQKAAHLRQLDQLLKTLIDKEIAAHCCVANYRDNILVIQCENAAWATRFKFLIPELLKNFRQNGQLRSLVSISLIIAR